MTDLDVKALSKNVSYDWGQFNRCYCVHTTSCDHPVGGPINLWLQIGVALT